MDEGRKRVVLIAASILVARHLKNAEDLNDYRPTPRSEALIAKRGPRGGADHEED